MESLFSFGGRRIPVARSLLSALGQNVKIRPEQFWSVDHPRADLNPAARHFADGEEAAVDAPHPEGRLWANCGRDRVAGPYPEWPWRLPTCGAASSRQLSEVHRP